MVASEQESSDRSRVIREIVLAIESGAVIAFPRLGTDSIFCGRLGEFRYVFDGEDDLLHLQVERSDGLECSAEDGRSVATFVLKGVPVSLTWMKPGRHTQHFYVGHDDLIKTIEVT